MISRTMDEAVRRLRYAIIAGKRFDLPDFTRKIKHSPIKTGSANSRTFIDTAATCINVHPIQA